MVNYQNGKIYMIESIEGKCRYYGSTCEKLSQRMSKHRYSYNHNKKDTSSKKVLKYPDAKIFLILKYPCNSKEELNAKEAEYIRQFDCVNTRIDGRTYKQWREDNKELIAEKQKKYYQDNKETILIKSKQYRLENKEKIKKKEKKRREQNKEIIKQRAKKWRENNKEKIKKDRSTVINCECGSIYTKNHKARHNKSKKHLKFIEQQ